MRRWLIALALGLFVGLGGAGLQVSPLGGAFEQAVGLNWLFNMRGAVEPPRDVAVVAIDSRTGDALDLPTMPRDWPRSIHGELIKQLKARGASVIAFDVHFARAKDAESDQVFVDAVREAGNVILVELLTGKRQPITDQTGRNVGMVWAEELVPPFEGLAEAAAGLATFPLPKEGAAVYQFWSFKESADQAPSLPAVALQLRARDEAGALLARLREINPTAVSDLPDIDAAFSGPAELRTMMRAFRQALSEAAPPPALPPGVAPTLQQALEAMYAGEAHPFLNFYGPPGTVLNVPYQSVIKGEDPNLPAGALDFTGKVVFVGYSDLFDPGQPDRFYTVFTKDDGVDLSGVEIAATAFANLSTIRTLAPVGGWTALGLVFLFGLLLGLITYLMPGYLGVPLALILTGGYAFAAQSLFNDEALVFPFATPMLLQAPLALLLGLLGQYLIERSRGQRISEAIQNYLPEEIVRELAQNKLDPSQLNRVVYSTCLATDMAGFSTIAEGLPPGELAEFLNDYFETLAAPLKQHGVHVTEFRADAIMCAWTSNEPSPEPRRQALLAALEAGKAIETFKQRHSMFGASLRIGLEAGNVYVGHAGGGGRFVYSIVGDSANTASRMEGLNKHVGTEVLATAEVVEGFDDLLTRYLGDFQFVGKTEGIPVFEVISERETASETQLGLCEAFAAALEIYHRAEWDKAAAFFAQVLSDYGEDGPSKFYLARCEQFSKDAGEAGDPRVIRMTSK